MHRSSFTWLRLALCTKPVCTRFLFCFLVFLVKMWLWKACFLLILPVPVRANLFLEPELVLIFGILLKFKIIIIQTVVAHYTGALRTFFLFLLFFHFLRIDRLFLLRSSTGLLRSQWNGHSLTFQNRHLFYLGILFQVVGKTKEKYFPLFFE